MNGEGDSIDDMVPAELLRHARDIKHLHNWMTSLAVGQQREMADLYRELSTSKGQSFAAIARALRHSAERRGYIGPDDYPSRFTLTVPR